MVTPTSVLVVTLFTFSFASSARLRRQSDGKCLMLGVCDTTGYAFTPCYEETAHHKFDAENTTALTVLRKECPKLFKIEG